MTKTVDVVISGAGFAGLACAERLAKAGASVVVLDRKKQPGQGMHTTGILVREASELLELPENLVRRITDVHLYSPSLKSIHLHTEGYFFYATDTSGLMRHLSELAGLAGAEVRYAAPYESAVERNGGYYLPAYDLQCRYLIGADGPRSAVAKDFGLGVNTRFLLGVEAEVAGAQEEANAFHCFLTQKLAPGYLGWVVPGVGLTQVGIAVCEPHKPDIHAFLKHAAPWLPSQEVIAHRGGLIPVGGVVEPFARGNVMLLGDSAGIVSPLTAGGIHTALYFGQQLGERLAKHIRGEGAHPVEFLARAYPRFRFKRFERYVFERFAPDWLLDATIGNPLTKLAAEQIFFRVQKLGRDGA